MTTQQATVPALSNTETPAPLPAWLEKGYVLLFALLPWSVDVDLGNWNIFLPSEPLLLVIGLGVFYEISRVPQRAWKQVSGNRLFLVSLGWLAWMAVAALFSRMGQVSLKYWLVEAGHWWVFALGFVRWPALWHKTMPYLLLSILGLVVYTVIHHGFYGFRADQALLAPMPFLPDHTLYGAVLVMAAFFVQTLPCLIRSRQVVLAIFVPLALMLSLLLSGSRAAILSCLIAAGVYLCARFYRKFRRLVLGGLLLAALVLPVIAELAESKLANDVSFQERINRWDCAAVMLQMEPWTGFGPGTFSFQYRAFQKTEKMTRISVQEALTRRGPDTYGRGGGVHSEYGQAAAELGWPGLLIWLALVMSTLWIGFRHAIMSADARKRQHVLFIVLGLLSFFIHALVNNFLHDGRVAALVWTGIAWISVAESKRNIERN